MIIEDELIINAPVDTVWRLNTDVEAWPVLSPTTMQRVERLDDGPMRVGSQARVKQPVQRATIWTVTRVQPNELFEWETKLMGVHTVARHRLSEAEGGVRNHLSIEMTGRGSRLLGRLFAGRIRAAISTENRAFKTTAEASSTVGGPAS